MAMAPLGLPESSAAVAAWGGLIVGYLGSAHRCAWNPCRAVYPRSKYGPIGPPLHIQPSDWKPPAGADAEAADDSSGDSSDSSGDSSGDSSRSDGGPP